MLVIDPKIAANPILTKEIEKTCQSLIASNGASKSLILKIAAKFRLKSLEGTIMQWLNKGSNTVEFISESLRALSEMGSTNEALFKKYITHKNINVRTWAITGLANTVHRKQSNFASQWDTAAPTRNKSLLHLSSKKNAELFADAILVGSFKGITRYDLESIFPSSEWSTKRLKRFNSNPGLLGATFESKASNVLSNLDIKEHLRSIWVKINDSIDNLINCQLRQQESNFNFHNGKPHFMPAETSLVREASSHAGHIAITRDKKGILKLYIDGELDTTGRKWPHPLTRVQFLKSVENKGNDMSIANLRVWNYDRKPAELLAHFTTDFSTSPQEGVIYQLNGESKKVQFTKGARMVLSPDFPKLITPEEALKAKARFDHVVALGQRKGNASKGKQHFMSCAGCHDIGGEQKIGPTLSGIGKMSVEAITHNILTPNAKMESGYYTHEVITKEGVKYQGFGKPRRQVAYHPTSIGWGAGYQEGSNQQTQSIEKVLNARWPHWSPEWPTNYWSHEYFRSIGK